LYILSVWRHPKLAHAGTNEWPVKEAADLPEFDTSEHCTSGLPRRCGSEVDDVLSCGGSALQEGSSPEIGTTVEWRGSTDPKAEADCALSSRILDIKSDTVAKVDMFAIHSVPHHALGRHGHPLLRSNRRNTIPTPLYLRSGACQSWYLE